MEFPILTIPDSLDGFIEAILGNEYTVHENVFEEVRESVLANRKVNEDFDYTKTCCQNIYSMARCFESGKMQGILIQLQKARYFPTLSRNVKMAKALQLVGDNYTANGELSKAYNFYWLGSNFTPIKKSACVQIKPINLPNDEINNNNEEEFMSMPDPFKVAIISGRGKCLIATEPLVKGTTIVIEEAYVHVTKTQLKWQMSTCDRCLKALVNPVPCQNCVFLKYCSIECRDEDQSNGHNYECPVLPALHAMKIPDAFHLALKIVCKCGPEILYKYRTLLMDFDDDHAINDSSFWIVSPFLCPEAGQENYKGRLKFNRVTKEEKQEKLFGAYTAIAIAQALRSNSTFFTKFPDKSNFQTFIAVVLLRHYVAFSETSSEINGIGNEDNNSSIATGIYSKLNLINRTGTKNIIRQDLPFGKIGIVTTQDVAVGEELCLIQAPILEEIAPRKQSEPNVEFISGDEDEEGCWDLPSCAIL